MNDLPATGCLIHRTLSRHAPAHWHPARSLLSSATISAQSLSSVLMFTSASTTCAQGAEKARDNHSGCFHCAVVSAVPLVSAVWRVEELTLSPPARAWKTRRKETCLSGGAGTSFQTPTSVLKKNRTPFQFVNDSELWFEYTHPNPDGHVTCWFSIRTFKALFNSSGRTESYIETHLQTSPKRNKSMAQWLLNFVDGQIKGIETVHPLHSRWGVQTCPENMTQLQHVFSKQGWKTNKTQDLPRPTRHQPQDCASHSPESLRTLAKRACA